MNQIRESFSEPLEDCKWINLASSLDQAFGSSLNMLEALGFCLGCPRQTLPRYVLEPYLSFLVTVSSDMPRRSSSYSQGVAFQVPARYCGYATCKQPGRARMCVRASGARGEIAPLGPGRRYKRRYLATAGAARLTCTSVINRPLSGLSLSAVVSPGICTVPSRICT